MSAAASGPDIPVSHSWGVAPRWNPTGDEIFFLSEDGTMMVAEVAAGSRKVAPRITKLFTPDQRTVDEGLTRNLRPYAVSKDGQRFLMRVPVGPNRPVTLTVGLDWTTKVLK